MEPIHGSIKALKITLEEEEEDVISRMPENVITNILDRLPIEDAVRTSILSREWSFKWTMLTRLVFDYEMRDYGKDITRVLLHLKGPITKFYISTPEIVELDVEDVSHWVSFLSRKGIKEILFDHMHETPLKLPTRLFSCLELKHLTLNNCCFRAPSIFCGFPNLLSLELCRVAEIGNCVEFFTKCPLLEILKITDFNPVGKVKLVEIAKLKNLKILSLPLRILDNLAISSSTIFELGGYLPKLQELNLNFQKCLFLDEAGERKWVCTAFPCLKTLTLYPILFGTASMLSFAFEMIWGSPNLQNLTIRATYNRTIFPLEAFCFPEVDNNTKLQLQSVVFDSLRGSENEVYLIKSLLACSPLLQNITIHVKSSKVFGGDDGKLMFATKLLELDRASPTAKVNLY